MASKQGTYLFVKIPADESETLVEICQGKEGGLTDDTLIAYSRQYFDGNMCDISALTIPKSQNNYTGVSMYHCPSNETANKRATALVTGCGLSTAIQGDAFVGRYYDNEEHDVWERRDFVTADAHPSATWCVQARQASGGSSSQASSLSGILQQQLQGSNTTVVQPPPSSSNNAFGTNGSFVMETWGRWSQTDEEVEVLFPIDATVSSKDVQIVFKRSSLSVKIQDKVVLTGNLFNAVVVDECTYTLQTDNDGKKEVCVNLLKFQTGSTWSYAVHE